MMLRSLKLVLPVASLSSMLVACGTTVPLSGGVGDSTGLGATTVVPGAGDGATGATATGGEAQSASGLVGGVGGTSIPGASSGVGTGRTGGVVGPAASVPANKPIRLGLVYTDIGAIYAVFGKSNATSVVPDTAKKFVSYINKHGGIAGRQVEAVFAQGDSAASSSTNGQVACSALTEDTKVDLVVNLGMLSDELPSCLQQRGLAMLDGLEVYTDQVDAHRHPNWLMPDTMRLDRSAPALLQNSVERGLLKRGDTVGVLREDCPWGPRIFNNVVVPEARRLGLKLVEGTVKCLDNLVADIGPISNDIQREELRFFSAGVTHVTTLSMAEAFLMGQFSQSASKQDYHPKYLVTSQAYPFQNSQDDAVIKISPDAVPNLVGLGTFPLLDLGNDARPVNAGQAAAQKWCRTVDPTMMSFRSESGNGKYFHWNGFYRMCDLFAVTKALLEANGARTSIPDVIRGFRVALNGSLPSAMQVSGRFGLGGQRLDGVGVMRPYAFDVKRDHLVYVGQPVNVS
jgi:hypothetical protein